MKRTCAGKLLQKQGLCIRQLKRTARFTATSDVLRAAKLCLQRNVKLCLPHNSLSIPGTGCRRARNSRLLALQCESGQHVFVCKSWMSFKPKCCPWTPTLQCLELCLSLQSPKDAIFHKAPLICQRLVLRIMRIAR